MKTLVVYYSLTGHTQGIAERIAAECEAEIEQIKDVKTRTGAWAMLSSGREALFNRPALTQPTEKDPAKYDLVILGTPVWAWNMSSPMRAYITQHSSKFDRVAFFCTMGGSGSDRTFGNMSDLIGKQPIATLEITETDLKTGSDGEKLKQFTGAITQITDSFSQKTTEAGRNSPRETAA